MSKHQVGDRVRLLPYAEIRSRFYESVHLPSNVAFVDEMKRYCGVEFEVRDVIGSRHTSGGVVGLYKLSFLNGERIGWTFTDEMFESDYEASLPLSISMSFDELLE